VGEYAQSALARERVLEFFCRTQPTSMAILRLNYAIELRYGVLRDLADRIVARQPIDLAMGRVNLIWQRDANAIALRTFAHCASPPLVLNANDANTQTGCAALDRLVGTRIAVGTAELRFPLLTPQMVDHFCDRSMALGAQVMVTVALAPAAYHDVSVKSGRVLQLRTGTYYFDSLRVEPQAGLQIDGQAGPVYVFVNGVVSYAGNQNGSVPTPGLPYASLTVMTSNSAFIGNSPTLSRFNGVVIAPNGSVSLSGIFQGAFFGRNVTLFEDSRGMRSILDGNIRKTEPVGMRPTRPIHRSGRMHRTQSAKDGMRPRSSMRCCSAIKRTGTTRPVDTSAPCRRSFRS